MAKTNKLTAAERLAALKAEMSALETEAAQENAENTKRINAKIEELPKFLGVETMGEAMKAIAAFKRGLNAGKAGKVGHRLSDEVKEQARQMFRDGKQVSEVVATLGISAPTAYNLRKEVKGTAPAETPAPAAQ